MSRRTERQQVIVEVLETAFADLMERDPDAFRETYRRMAYDPYSFLRGSAMLFSRDLSSRRDRWAKGDAARVWIHGDLHCQNFGSYLDDRGRPRTPSTSSSGPSSPGTSRTMGRAAAKVHCSSDADSSAGLVDVQVEDAIHDAVHAQREAFVEDLVVQARRDADRCRTDHELFVDAFRRGLVGGIDPT